MSTEIDLIWPAPSDADRSYENERHESPKVPTDLVGATIAFIDNTKPNLDVLYAVLKRRFVADLGVQDLLHVKKLSMALPMDQAQRDALRDVGFAVYAVDD